MPRQARLDYEGCLHHLINRGMERRTLFRTRKDYEFFRKRLGELLEEEGQRCYAWVLMPNHFHLLIETGTRGIARFMSRLQTGYAGYFNRKYRRSGRLFQNRYKSIVCDKDNYFRELVAYIHLNPLKARMVNSLRDLGNYEWSGHRCLLGLEKLQWMERQEALRLFGDNVGSARRIYLQYLTDHQKDDQDLEGCGLMRSAGGKEIVLQRGKNEHTAYDSRMLGEGEFVAGVFRAKKKEDRHRVKLPGKERWIKSVYEKMEVGEEEINKKGKTTRRGTRVRAILSYVLVEYFGEKKVRVAERFHLDPSVISRLCTRGQELLEDEQLRREVMGNEIE